MSEKTRTIIFSVVAFLFAASVIVSAVFTAIGKESIIAAICVAVTMVAFVTVASIFRFTESKDKE